VSCALSSEGNHAREQRAGGELQKRARHGMTSKRDPCARILLWLLATSALCSIPWGNGKGPITNLKTTVPSDGKGLGR
jgi:hypothetical protein